MTCMMVCNLFISQNVFWWFHKKELILVAFKRIITLLIHAAICTSRNSQMCTKYLYFSLAVHYCYSFGQGMSSHFPNTFIWRKYSSFTLLLSCVKIMEKFHKTGLALTKNNFVFSTYLLNMAFQKTTLMISGNY